MGRKKPTTSEETAAIGGGGKSKKKNLMIDDDEYSVGTELSEEFTVQEEKIAPVAAGNKKKGKKGNSKKMDLKDDDDDEEDYKLDGKNGEEEDDETPVMQFAGKKKSKGKKGVTFSSFSLLGDEDNKEENSGLTHDRDGEGGGSEDEDEAENVMAFTGKKKPTKSKRGSAKSTFSALGEEDDEGVGAGKLSDIDEEPVISFSGKKKPSKTSKTGGDSVFPASAFDALGDEDEDGDRIKKSDEDEPVIEFSGKKKKSSKKSTSKSFVSAALDDEETNDTSAQDEDEGMVMFSGKKKSSKKKSNSTFSALDAGLVAEQDEPSLNSSTMEIEDPKIKNKKKKKKSGRTAQEEEDLDKILAELGEAPTISKPAPAPAPVPAPAPTPAAAGPPEEEVQSQSQPELEGGAGDKDVEEEGPAESAAAKKKKKKKEKEKEKKAAATVVTASAAEEKQKVSDKKIPKHVREMQERLARLKEEEERKKREEEERLRKEEEERLRQEELERLAEEKKRLKKEKEKEKLLKKKQEGKLLTGKQKEEARRRDAMLKQILANAGGLPLPTGESTGVSTKRPKYQTKKSKHQPQSNIAPVTETAESSETNETEQEHMSEMDLTETEQVNDVHGVDKPPEIDVTEENGLQEEDDDDEEWDAKSWDDADLKLPGKSAFEDEEVDSEPEHVVKKEMKSARPAMPDAGAKSDNVENGKVGPQLEETVKSKRQQIAAKKAPKSEAPPSEGEKDLRSPICCIMGHVDTGKTKLLDCIRGTNVQEGEAGGITQQIGATYFPAENIRERTRELKADAKLKVPGLLVIDTPGHESFTNLRSRGSGLCDIAILVVDIMHGLEPQTIESLNLLKMRNTEFIVALNKVDRLYGWKTCRNAPIVKAMKQQSKDVQMEFNTRLNQVILEFKEQGINTELYYKNKEMGETTSIVPTSAISGEGVPDMLLLLVQWAQKTMVDKLTYSNEVEGTVLEVKVVEGHGTTIDVVLVNGVLHEGDQIVVCGMQGPIVTTIRALLTPHPMKELRVKGTYLHHKEIKAAQGIKIAAQGLEHAIAGTGLYVVGSADDLEDIKEAAMEDMKSVMNRIDKSGEGVYVQASTLGSLEALLEFLKTPAVSIPVSGIGIGPVHKKDVMKASVMLEKKKEYATILAFDVRVTPEARELADELGVRIFCADIIYHLFDQFKAYIDNLKEEKKKEAAEDAVFPCVLKIIPDCVFNKKDPIVLGVDILEGILKIGTPICVPQKEFTDIGRIASIENNHKPVDYARKGQKVAIKIIGSNPEEQQKMFGRHFEIEDELVSRISRRSIDILKANYREDLSMEEWKLVVKLKTIFKIQ